MYISKFIDAYAGKGVPIWGLTPQNEPEFPAPWEACAYNVSYMKDWIQEYLGPVMRSNHPDLKILAFDHNKDHLFSWAQVMYGYGNVAAHDYGSGRKYKKEIDHYVDGMAFHCKYTGFLFTIRIVSSTPKIVASKI